MLVAEHVFVWKFDNGSDRVIVRKWRRGLLILDQNLPRVSGQFQSSVPNPVLPCILPVSSQNGVWSGLLSKSSSNHYFWCNICRVEHCCGHQGHTDVERHISSDGHAKKTKDIPGQPAAQKLFSFSTICQLHDNFGEQGEAG